MWVIANQSTFSQCFVEMTSCEFFLGFVRSRVSSGSLFVLLLFWKLNLIECHLHPIGSFYPRIAIPPRASVLGERAASRQPAEWLKPLLQHLELQRPNELDHSHAYLLPGDQQRLLERHQRVQGWCEAQAPGSRPCLLPLLDRSQSQAITR